MIDFDENQFRRIQEVLQHLPNDIPKAAASAINRANESARTEAVRKARDEYVIQASQVRKTIDIRKASASNLFASMRSKGRPRPLSMFKIRQGRRGSGQGAGALYLHGGKTDRRAPVGRDRGNSGLSGPCGAGASRRHGNLAAKFLPRNLPGVSSRTLGTAG